MLALGMLALIASLAADASPLVFGSDSTGWVALSRDGRVLRRMTELCGARAEELALSPGLGIAAFTAWSQTAQNRLLFACDDGAAKPRLLGEAMGYHAQPTFSVDGEWVFFVHHPKKGGPPGSHEPGANAQLYRVRHDGTKLEALTATSGCKLGPRPVAQDLLVLIHATCDGPQGIELMRVSDKRVIQRWTDGLYASYPDLTVDGRLLFTQRKPNGADLVELEPKTKRRRTVWSVPEGYEDTRARWSSDGRAVFFQQGESIWKLNLGSKPSAERLTGVGG